MLDLAFNNQQKLKDIFSKKIFEKVNFYYNMNPYIDYEVQVDYSEWHRIQYVSKTLNDEVLAYFCAWVNRPFNIIEKLEVINLSGKPNIIATKDFFDFLKLLLVERKFRKLVFYVIKDNPAIKLYKKFVLGNKIGRLVGIFKKHCILTDGNCYDQYIFEIYGNKFEQWVKKRI